MTGLKLVGSFAGFWTAVSFISCKLAGQTTSALSAESSASFGFADLSAGFRSPVSIAGLGLVAFPARLELAGQAISVLTADSFTGFRFADSCAGFELVLSIAGLGLHCAKLGPLIFRAVAL